MRRSSHRTFEAAYQVLDGPRTTFRGVEARDRFREATQARRLVGIETLATFDRLHESRRIAGLEVVFSERFEEQAVGGLSRQTESINNPVQEITREGRVIGVGVDGILGVCRWIVLNEILDENALDVLGCQPTPTK